jgi:hypothetical protein
MIVWLASYPKSGNTWVRGFIASLIYTKDGNSSFKNLSNISQYPLRSHFINLCKNLKDISEIKKFWHHSQDIINLDKKIKILKTHNALLNIRGDNFSSTKNTLGVIHIIRDPRNVVSSIKNYYSLNNYEDAKKFIFDENRVIQGNYDLADFPISTLISSWGVHYRSWSRVKKNYLKIKYENLINNPDKEFTKIANYLSELLKISFSEEKIKKSINSNSFESLKNQETINGFSESSNSGKPFFNLGPNNRWEKLIDEKIVKEIEIKFNEEMKELKYIGP